jgi:spore coat polysaccharide biosynthesis protein SpsF (cytidylyltransferase family)
VCTKHTELLGLLFFLEQYHKDGDEFLRHIVRVTGDEPWVSFVNVETKKKQPE